MAKDYWSWGTTKSRRGLFHFPSKAACSGYTLGYNWTCPGFSFSQSDKWERGGVSVQPLLQIEGGGKRLKVKDYVICDQLLIIIVWMCRVRRQRSTTAWILVLYTAGWRGHTLSYCHTYTSTPIHRTTCSGYNGHLHILGLGTSTQLIMMIALG